MKCLDTASDRSLGSGNWLPRVCAGVHGLPVVRKNGAVTRIACGTHGMMRTWHESGKQKLPCSCMNKHSGLEHDRDPEGAGSPKTADQLRRFVTGWRSAKTLRRCRITTNGVAALDLRLTDGLGRSVGRWNGNGPSVQLDLQHLAPGAYHLSINQGSETMFYTVIKQP